MVKPPLLYPAHNGISNKQGAGSYSRRRAPTGTTAQTSSVATTVDVAASVVEMAVAVVIVFTIAAASVVIDVTAVVVGGGGGGAVAVIFKADVFVYDFPSLRENAIISGIVRL